MACFKAKFLKKLIGPLELLKVPVNSNTEKTVRQRVLFLEHKKLLLRLKEIFKDSKTLDTKEIQCNELVYDKTSHS